MTSLKGKKILILGCGTWLVPYLQKAKQLGLTVYGTDWESSPSGAKYCDHFKQIDLKDKEATLKFATENKVDAIFTSADIGVQTAAYVAKKLGLKYHSEQLALSATNKFMMREKAKEIGLGIPLYFQTSTLDEAKEAAKKINFPLIIKPVDNFSSRGVSVLNNLQELEHFFNKSWSASFTGKVLLEEFMKGTEGSAEVLIKNGKAYIMGVCSKIKSELPYRYDLQLDYPGFFSPAQNELIVDFINKLVNGFKISDGIVHIEIIVNQNEIKLIEFAVRGCGSKVVTHLMPALLNFDVVEFLILNSLGIEKEIKFSRTKFGILKFIMLPKGVVQDIKGKEDVLKISGVIDFDIERKPGDKIDVIEDGRSRPGYLLACANNKEELNNVIETVMNSFTVDIIHQP